MLYVRSIQQQLRKEVHAHAKPTPPWPGGWPKFAFLVFLSWPDTGTSCSTERVFELMSTTEGVTADTVLCVQDVQALLRKARQVFQTHQAALIASGHQSHVFGVAQAIAATLFDVLHERELWHGGCDVDCDSGTGSGSGSCEVVRGGLSRETGVQYADKDCVMVALAELGKKAGAVLGHEGSAMRNILQQVWTPWQQLSAPLTKARHRVTADLQLPQHATYLGPPAPAACLNFSAGHLGGTAAYARFASGQAPANGGQWSLVYRDPSAAGVYP